MKYPIKRETPRILCLFAQGLEVLLGWCNAVMQSRSWRHVCSPADSLSFNVAHSQTMPLWWLPLLPSQSILFPARGGLEDTAGSQAKGHWQDPNARSYHGYSDPETGIPTLCAAKHVCLLTSVIISVPGLYGALHIQNKSSHLKACISPTRLWTIYKLLMGDWLFCC